MPDEEVKPVARPTAYKAEYCKQAYKLSLLGATDKKIADFFGVKEQTINNWKRSHPEFFESLKKGKETADATVIQSLFKRATGYKHKATKIMQYQGEVVTEDYTEHYPPDTVACIFWLKNRQPEIWREKPQPAEDGDATPVKVMLTVKDASKKK